MRPDPVDPPTRSVSHATTAAGIEPEVSYANTTTFSRTGPRLAMIGSWPSAARTAPRFLG